MDYDAYIKLTLLLVLLFVSAFFSGSEVALFSLDKGKIKELLNKYPLIGGYIQNLLEFPKRLLVTILIGNTLVNVAITIISVNICLKISAAYNLPQNILMLAQIVAVTALVILAGEITPKVWAARHPVVFSRIAGFPLYWISVLVYPVAKIITDLIKYFSSKVKFNHARTAILTSEITNLADLGIEKGGIEEEEHELIHGLVSYRTVTAREVMTPRMDITAVSVDTEFEELLKLVSESGHSRIPLYENNLDEVVGVIYAKDLLPYLKSSSTKEALELRKISRKAMFIPETKLISELMREFQEKKMHVGIVVDEYGGTAGLISMEDILEEIVGEIRDEYDKDEGRIVKTGDNSFIVLGKLTIDELNEVLQPSPFEEEHEEYETVGGFILSYAGSIPAEGYSFEFRNYRFTVKEITNKRVKKVLVEILNSDEKKAVHD